MSVLRSAFEVLSRSGIFNHDAFFLASSIAAGSLVIDTGFAAIILAFPSFGLSRCLMLQALINEYDACSPFLFSLANEGPILWVCVGHDSKFLRGVCYQGNYNYRGYSIASWRGGGGCR